MRVAFCKGGILQGWPFVWVAFYEGAYCEGGIP